MLQKGLSLQNEFPSVAKEYPSLPEPAGGPRATVQSDNVHVTRPVNSSRPARRPEYPQDSIKWHVQVSTISLSSLNCGGLKSMLISFCRHSCWAQQGPPDYTHRQGCAPQPAQGYPEHKDHFCPLRHSGGCWILRI